MVVTQNKRMLPGLGKVWSDKLWLDVDPGIEKLLPSPIIIVPNTLMELSFPSLIMVVDLLFVRRPVVSWNRFAPNIIILICLLVSGFASQNSAAVKVCPL